MIKSIRYNADGSIDTLKEYTEFGTPTKWIGYKDNGGIYKWTEYEYDEFGNQTEEREYNADGSVRYKYVYEHGELGERIKTTKYDALGNEVAE